MSEVQSGFRPDKGRCPAEHRTPAPAPAGAGADRSGRCRPRWRSPIFPRGTLPLDGSRCQTPPLAARSGRETPELARS